MGISFGGAGGVTSAGTGYKSSDLVYERVASTLAAPVPAGASDYVLINWTVPNTRKGILLTSVGTDQHDNTRYTWVVDGVILPISGSARAGSILQPMSLDLRSGWCLRLYLELQTTTQWHTQTQVTIHPIVFPMKGYFLDGGCDGK